MSSKGFTLAEILVSLGVLAILMTILTQIFFNSVRSGTKSQTVGVINENGRYILDMVDKDVRLADEIICPAFFDSASSDDGVGNVLVVLKSGTYTRYRFEPPKIDANGYVERDNPIPDGEGENQNLNIFAGKVCFPGKIVTNNLTKITDNNPTTGVSVVNGLFTRHKNAGGKDSVTIKFDLLPSVSASNKMPGRIDPVTFSTTVGPR